MTLRRSFLIYLTSTGLAAAVPILLMPILTRQLAPSDYGQMSMLLTLVALLTPMVSFGSLPFIGVAFHQQDAQGLRRTLSSVLWIPVITSLVLTVVGALIGRWLTAPLGLPPIWITLAPLIALATTLPQVMLILLRMRDQPVGYGVVEVGNSVLNFLATLALLMGVGLGWTARGVAMAATGLVLSAIALIWLRRHNLIGEAPRAQTMREAVRFGAGVVPHDVANQGMRIADRFMIMALMGTAAAGEYAVAAQMAAMMLLILSAFNRAWTPFLFSRLKLDTPEADAEIVRMMRYAILAIVAGYALFVALVPVLFDLLVDPRYHGAIGPTIWIATGHLFVGIYLTYVDNIFFLKKTAYLSMVTGSAVVLNVVLSYVLIGHYGVGGAGIAFAGTSAAIMIATFVIVNRLRPLPWSQLLFGGRHAPHR